MSTLSLLRRNPCHRTPLRCCYSTLSRRSLSRSTTPGPSTPSKGAVPDNLFGPSVRVHDLPPKYSQSLRLGRLGPQPRLLLLYRKDGKALWPRDQYRTLVDIPGSSFTHPMLCWVQIVSTPTADTPGACVLLHFDNRRYVFGRIPEGTQRVMNQRKIGLSKLDELFITGPVSWGSTGGLLGMILTIADVVALRGAPDDSAKKQKKKKDQGLSLIPSLKIYAAENISHALATARRFIFRKGLPLEVHELRHTPAHQGQEQRPPDFVDSNVRVWAVSVKPEVQPKPQGRKRSHDDMLADETGQSTSQNLDDRVLEENRRIVETVVGHMFDSNWQLDALVETTLHKVELPAKIFVKGPDGKITNYDGPMPGDAGDVPDIPVFTRTPWPATRINQLPPTSPSNQSLSYIVLQQPRRGKFKVQEALRLGVAKFDFSKLTAGETVKGADGVDVTPEMCVEPTIEGRGFAVVDLPDLSYVEPFLARPEWTTESLVKNIDVMYWMLGPNVAQDRRIQDYMKSRQSVRHNVFSPEASPNYISMEGAAGNTIKSHRIDPDRFPLPVYNNKSEGEESETFVAASPGAKVQLAPRVLLQDEESFPPMDTVSLARDMDEEVQKLAEEAKARISDPHFLDEIEETEQDIPNRDTEIIPLGTGSALPSKYRNVSATLVRVPGHGAYLFDCGENTLGQLRRMYGYDRANEILRDLKVIWISHLHADHHLGTASFIKAWNDATASDRSRRLAVASHRNMLDWLREYADVEDYGFDRLRTIEIKGNPRAGSKQEPWVFNANLAREFGITRIDAARVEHCHGSLACVFTWPSGLRIAYSGDCRPSSVFAEIARDCTLLIHESTLDDELRDDALYKKHCTMSEALGVAKEMRARRVLLTHFSQRYPKIANTSAGGDGAPVKDQVVLMAFDQMCVKLGDFKKAALFLPALRKLYEEAPDDEPPRLD
jgi:ribonuclease Z